MVDPNEGFVKQLKEFEASGMHFQSHSGKIGRDVDFLKKVSDTTMHY